MHIDLKATAGDTVKITYHSESWMIGKTFKIKKVKIEIEEGNKISIMYSAAEGKIGLYDYNFEKV